MCRYCGRDLSLLTPLRERVATLEAELSAARAQLAVSPTSLESASAAPDTSLALIRSPQDDRRALARAALLASTLAFVLIATVLALGFVMEVKESIHSYTGPAGERRVSSTVYRQYDPSVWSVGVAAALATLIPLGTGIWIGRRLPHPPWQRVALVAPALAIGVGAGFLASETLKEFANDLAALGHSVAFDSSEAVGRRATLPGAIPAMLEKNLEWSLVASLSALLTACILLVLSGKAIGGWWRRRAGGTVGESLGEPAREFAVRVVGARQMATPAGLARLEHLTKVITALGPLLTFVAAILGSVLTFVATLLTAGAGR